MTIHQILVDARDQLTRARLFYLSGRYAEAQESLSAADFMRSVALVKLDNFGKVRP